MNYAIHEKSVQEQLNKKDSYNRYKGIALPIACSVFVAVTPHNYRAVDYVQLPAGWHHNDFMGIEAHLVNVPRLDSVESVTPRAEALAKEFHKLVTQWRDETFFMSSLGKQFTHPAYVRIMAMGIEGIPLVLSEMQKSQDNWFYALKFMAGDEGKDVAAEIEDFESAKAAWLEWGYSKNYI